jgi:hypothetical protein
VPNRVPEHPAKNRSGEFERFKNFMRRLVAVPPGDQGHARRRKEPYASTRAKV